MNLTCWLCGKPVEIATAEVVEYSAHGCGWTLIACTNCTNPSPYRIRNLHHERCAIRKTELSAAVVKKEENP